jgi:hypothetical protein
MIFRQSSTGTSSLEHKFVPYLYADLTISSRELKLWLWGSLDPTWCSAYSELLFWSVWGLNPGLFGLKTNNGDQRTKRPTDLSEKM